MQIFDYFYDDEFDNYEEETFKFDEVDPAIITIFSLVLNVTLIGNHFFN
jgi:hypothetical protein